ncbi:MAG: 30S ribosomal protein S2 [Proteobacteria bacterium]|nr:30S ribosomal protein S2 [Pseudomonadota bacterium]MBU4294972.1 30S ribosomal protein S2 [Pseudomonadota bacterium]MCG2746676.1 30S ribosomal protein S2 [Desulfobulbaceae bacterium]
MAYITMKEMLVAGLHFGHQTRRWNPKMKPYIFGARNKIYIINLDKTLPLFNKAYEAVVDNITKGGSILFVGTKRQAQDIVKEEANRVGMHYINHRWLGGMLTNFQTIKKSVDRMKSIQSMSDDGSIHRYKKKEALGMEKELVKLERNLGGIKDMKSLPSMIFIIDPKREDIAVVEANRLGIPVIAIADTNCDPDGINHLIPGNDDAIRSIKLITSKIADAVLAGKAKRGEEVVETDDAIAVAMAAANVASSAGSADIQAEAGE